MSRHELNRTDDCTSSVLSATDSLNSLMALSPRTAGDLTRLDFLDETSLCESRPEQILNRMLSTKTYISTTFSAAAAERRSQDVADSKYYKKIGEGQCGTIWTRVESEYVLKLPQENKDDQLWNDSVNHKQIEEAFQSAFVKLRQHISIPRYIKWIHPTENFWDDDPKVLRSGIDKTYAFMTSRIFPLPLPVCAALVDAFAPKHVKADRDNFLKNDKQQQCLVRLYLGRREKRSSTRGFRLRNFDLTVGEMEHLKLDTMMYAVRIASALAVLHWKAHVDADDVEFVLGSSPVVKTAPTAAELRALNKDDVRFINESFDVSFINGSFDFHNRSVSLWLLDFDQCKEFPDGKRGVEQLKNGFYRNDPYYPRPFAKDPKDVALWETFKEEYLDASASLTDSYMPTAFIEAVEVEGKRRRDGGSMFQ